MEGKDWRQVRGRAGKLLIIKTLEVIRVLKVIRVISFFSECVDKPLVK